MRKSFAAAVLIATLSQAPAWAAHYTVVDMGGDTWLQGINAKGQVVGVAGGNGFIRDTDGTIVPWAISGYVDPIPTGINDRGDIAGYATYSCGNLSCNTGFLRLADGAVTTFSASGTPGDGTTVMALNAKDETAGFYIDTVGFAHGFLRQRNGSVTTVDVPGAQATFLSALNDEGYAAGYYQDTAVHGLLVAPDGSQTLFDVSGAQATRLLGMNDDGTAVGVYVHDGFVQTAFIRGTDGTITTIDGASMSSAVAIDRLGNVAGNYQPEKRGLVFLQRASGKLVTVRAKGSVGMNAIAVNDRGTVVGHYTVRLSKHSWRDIGFIWRP